MNIKTVVTIAAILVVLGAGIAVARPAATEGGFWNGMMGGLNKGINGMMGMLGQGNSYGGMMGQGNGYGGMMGRGNGYRGMMGQGTGNGTLGGCGGYGNANAARGATGASPITIEQAKESVEKYLSTTGNNDLVLTEVLEFDNNFYASVKEKSTGTYAFELLVNKYTGVVVPEMGPNMMWNTKYGHMTLNTQESNTVTEKQAIETAQKYLDTALPGTEVKDADSFYGYYTLEVNKDGKIYGMLSVNANTGAVWYHNWHGTFIKLMEVK